jgi:hypothetical protein
MPTKVAGRGEISLALVNARMNVKMIGMIKKVINKTPAGTSINQAMAAGLRPIGLLPRGGATAAAATGVGSISVVLTGILLWFRGGAGVGPGAAVAPPAG